MPTRVLVLGSHPARGHALRRLTRLTARAWQDSGAEVLMAARERPAGLRGALRRAGSGIDLVHVIDPVDVRIAAPARGEIPIAVTCHDLSDLIREAAPVGGPSARQQAHPMRRRQARAVLRELGRVDRLIATSRHTADEIESVVGRPALVLYPPVDPELGGRSAPADGWGPPTWPYVLTLAGHRSDSGRGTVITAWANLRRTPFLDGVSLVVVGSPLSPAEEAQVTACGGHVTVVGEVGDDQLAALFRQSRAVLALGRPRGFVWPIAEAHQAGRPVLATDHPVFLESGHAGCVYLPVEGVGRFDEATWSSIAEDLTSSTVADRALVNAERFAWHRFVEQLPARAFPGHRERRTPSIDLTAAEREFATAQPPLRQVIPPARRRGPAGVAPAAPPSGAGTSADLRPSPASLLPSPR
jgi:glycosyltransferase involved in cell wall biosynthesis